MDHLKATTQILQEMKKKCDKDEEKIVVDKECDTNKKNKKNSKDVDQIETIDESYKDTQAKYITKLVSVAKEICDKTEYFLKKHNEAIEASKKIRASIDSGSKVSEDLYKSSSFELYNAKDLARCLENCLDDLVNSDTNVESNAGSKTVSESASHTRGATKAQKMNDQESQSGEDFINKHKHKDDKPKEVDIKSILLKNASDSLNTLSKIKAKARPNDQRAIKDRK